MEKKKIDIPRSLTQSMLTPQEECLEVPKKKQKLYIGIPKETSFQETRVALSPSAVKKLVSSGHRIVVQENAGIEAGFNDFEYSEAGASIAYDQKSVYEASIILKAAPMSMQEIELCQVGQMHISPIHLPTLSEEYLYRLKQKRITAMAMEYMQDDSGMFPFVRIMSEIAGISAMQTAANLLSKSADGLGILLGGIAGVPPTKVVILGAGIVAEIAARVALGFGAEVKVFDNNTRKLMRLQKNLGIKVYTGTFYSEELELELQTADVTIGAIHSKTGRTPCIVTDDMVRQMKSGAVIIDVSIDQGGCFATSRLTSHKKPTFTKYDVTHYCVPNIVASVPQTSSKAISNIILPLLLEAGGPQGFERQMKTSPGLRNGVYMYKGCLTNKHLSDRFGIKYTDLNLLLATTI